MANKKFYLTSAIPYVNAAPHIGHAQEFVYADVIRRYHQLLGEDMRYLCGADENALKIVQAAENAKQDPQSFTDAHNKEFLALAEKLNVHFDVWQRGTDQKHHFPSCQHLLRRGLREQVIGHSKTACAEWNNHIFSLFLQTGNRRNPLFF